MIMSRVGSRRAAESAVEMALAMVDSNQLTVVRPSFGVSAPGGGRLRKGCDGMRTLAILMAKAKPIYLLTLVSSKRVE